MCMCVRKKGFMCVCVCVRHVPCLTCGASTLHPAVTASGLVSTQAPRPPPQASARSDTHAPTHTTTTISPLIPTLHQVTLPRRAGDLSEPPTRTGEATQHTMKMADLIKDIRLDPKPPGDFLVGSCAVYAGVESCLDTAVGFRPLSRGRALLRVGRARLSLVERCDLHGSSSEEEDILDRYQITWQSRSGYLLTSSHAR